MRGLLLCAAALVFGATAAKADLYEYTYTGNDFNNTNQFAPDNYLSISLITNFIFAPNTAYNFASSGELFSANFSYDNITALSYTNSGFTRATLLAFSINTGNYDDIDSWEIAVEDLTGDSSTLRTTEIISCGGISCLSSQGESGDLILTALDPEGFSSSFISTTPGTWSGPVDLSVTEIPEPTSLSLVGLAVGALGCCTFLKRGRGCTI